MRSCVNPEALRVVEEAVDERHAAWEELRRRYLSTPRTWRMEFSRITLEEEYLDPDRALVRITGGRCLFYELRSGKWEKAGEVDFSTRDFPALYLVRREGGWYLEALDLYILQGLEGMARAKA
jgi:hypothetical protein